MLFYFLKDSKAEINAFDLFIHTPPIFMSDFAKSHWLAVYTCPNAEKKIKVQLENREIETFLPLHKVIRMWSRGMKQLDVPLFPNYVFVKISLKQRTSVLSVPGVVRFIATEGKPSVISEKEIRTIKTVLAGNYDIDKSGLFDFEYGDRVRINDGPLSGIEGVLIEKMDQKRFVVQLEKINKTLSINISSCSLTKMESIYENNLLS